MKKKLFILILFFLSFCFVDQLFAQQDNIDFKKTEQTNKEVLNTVYVSFFYGEGCPHCAKAALFLEKISNEFDNLDFKIFEIYNNPENAKLLGEVGKELKKSVSGVPFIAIGTDVVYGYLNDETTGAQIKGIIEKQSKQGSIDVVGNLLAKRKEKEDIEKEKINSFENFGLISLPIFGELDPKTLSLPLLTIAIAAIDGFNPCAMWVLLFLISLLLGMENKKKMLALGSAFIISSGIVYFLFLSAWLNIFIFLGFITIVRVFIGLIAIGSGVFHIKEWWKNKNEVCKVTNLEQRKKIMEKLREITNQRSFVLAMIGIIGLAFAVNLIELVCSAGLPAIYTNILSLSNLPTYKYYLFLILYILIFMLDDLLIFFIAMTTLQATGISAKYSRWSNFIGGAVIFILGILLIFKPELIMFG